MEEESSTNIKLIIEKGPKEGESIEYKSNKLIKIGRVVRGNTFQIKESGISSNHISIHFDISLNKWMLTDLDSSNGTFLNAQQLLPNVATALNDGDCIKIGELTSIIVKIGMVAEPVVELRRNTRRSKPVVEEISQIGLEDKLGETVVEEGVGKRNLRGRGKKGVVTKIVVESAKNVEEISELGLDDKLGESVVEEGVGKRNLRARGKKAVDTKSVVESVSSRRTLRSSKKAEKVIEVPELSKIPEEATDVVAAAVEPKNTRGGKKKLLPVDQKLAEAVPVVGRRTRRGRMAVAAEDDVNETIRVDEGNEANNEPAQDQVVELPVDVSEAEAVPVVGRRTRRGRMAVAVESLKNVRSGGIEENVNNETAQDQVVEKLVLMEEGHDGMESVAGGSSVKGSSKVADVVQGKKVAEELESRQDGAEGSRKKTEPDSRKWDLDKMTVGDLLDYIKEQRTKEIIDESEKIIADLDEKARQCFRIRKKYENSKGKQATN